MITTEKEALDALDKFAGAIKELKQASDGFNIFDAVGMCKQEVKHSAFFAWLLDPKAGHGQGACFLHAFLDALFDYNKHISGVKPNREILSKFSRERLHAFAAAADDLVVKTEETLVGDDSRMDIYIRSDKSNITLVIENKTFTSTHDNQLNRYEELTAGNSDRTLFSVTLLEESERYGNYDEQQIERKIEGPLGVFLKKLKELQNSL